MLLRQPLTTVFGGSRARVLEALIDLEGSLSVREVARLTGMSTTTASTALAGLHRIGLVTRQNLGQSQHYRIEPAHALVSPLRAVAERARAVDSVVAKIVKTELPEAAALWLYGSRAVAREWPGSDGDLLAVFGRPGDAEAASAQAPRVSTRLGQLVGYTISLVCLPVPTPQEWRAPFWRNVLRDGVALAGPGPTELAQRGPAGARDQHPWVLTG